MPPLKVLLKARSDRDAQRTKMTEFLDRVSSDTLTAEEDREFRQMQANLAQLTAAVATLEADQARDAADAEAASASQSGQNHDPNTAHDARIAAARSGRLLDDGTQRPRRPAGVAGARYGAMFAGVPVDTETAADLTAANGFASHGEYLRCIRHGLYHPGLVAVSFNESSGADGGFLAPEQFASMLLDNALESEIVRPRATIQPMTSSTCRVTLWDDLDRSTALYGGLSADGAAESSTLTLQRPKLRRALLTAHKNGFVVPASNESLEDTDGAAGLPMAMAKTVSFGLDQLFFWGTGVGQALGIYNAKTLITVSPESGQATGSILWANIAKMLGRLLPASFTNSVWVVHPSTLPQLMQLSIPVGVAGSAVPALRESNGSFTLAMRPVIISEKASQVGTKGDIGLYDFSRYLVGLRREVTVDRSAHAGFQTDETYFRVTVRADGQPMDSAPITPANGTDTLSAFVALADR